MSKVLPGAAAVAALVSIAFSALAQDGLKFEATDGAYPVGISPSAIIVANLDGDLFPDLVVANADTDDLSVFNGTEDGSLIDTGTPFPTGSSPAALGAGDFDGDGKQDVVAVDEDDGTVSVLLNRGTLGLSEPMAIAVGDSPQRVAVGDFNRDGKPDLAVTVVLGDAELVDAAAILLGVGDGSFRPNGHVAVGAEPGAIVAADIDADGELDLVVANVSGGSAGTGSLTIAKGAGDGTFVALPELDLKCGGGADCAPVDVVAADLDVDSHKDLVVTNGEGDDVEVLFGRGNLEFSPSLAFAAPEQPAGVVVADFDGDGHADIATTGGIDDNVAVLLGDGAGAFAPWVGFPVGVGPSGIVAVDVDRDSKVDIVTVNTDDETITVLRNKTVRKAKCLGDCDGNGEVTVDELVGMVNVALGTQPISNCAAGDGDGSGEITVDEIIGAVNAALSGCPGIR